ncbi:hypothetical protein R3P38DRAFT_2662194 [Favolaschia claudopus]|uniref:Gag protein n=1 Tax=Favolaschia claudopus TaxID=2862362 RepID=A0AAV9ZJT5_9AGAR
MEIDSGNPRKRQREDSGTEILDSVPLSHEYPGDWRGKLRSLAAAGHAIPPPYVAKKLNDMRVEHRNRYDNALDMFRKALASKARFDGKLENGVSPTTVKNHVKLPPFQPVEGSPDISQHERVVNSLADTNVVLDSARKAATNHLSTLLNVQVEQCQTLVDITACTTRLVDDLKAYATRIIAYVDAENKDKWDPCIAMLRAEFIGELQNSNYDFAARQETAAENRVSKANKVETARADAEMIDATQPIKEMIKGEVQRYVKQYVQEGKTQEQPQASSSSLPPSKSSKPQPKASSSYSAKNKKRPQAVKAAKEKETKTSKVKESKPNAKAAKDGDATAKNANTHWKKGKGKQRAQ